MQATERCPRCEIEVEPNHRKWKYGPDGKYCPECGCPLHDVTIDSPTTRGDA
jgi:hypothetical protein